MENYQKRLDNAIENLKQRADIADVNKENIITFLNQRSAEDISIRRQLKYFYTLTSILKEFNKDFSLCNKKDIIDLINVNPSEKSPNFKLWDESHGELRSKRRQAFSPPGGKPRHSQ